MKNLIILIYLTLHLFALKAQPAGDYIYVVAANKVTAKVQPTMYGIFFEDINMGADGGVYAELVKNRSFEFNEGMMGWKQIKKDGGQGELKIVSHASDTPANPHTLQILLSGNQGSFGLSNEGFRGIGIKQGEQYAFSIRANPSTTKPIGIMAELVDESGKMIGRTEFQIIGSGWQPYTSKLKATATAEKARLNVWFKGKESLEVDMISLFPENTWKKRPGGLRADLVQKLADLKPGFLRFPGGCIVEGRELATRYQWKKTVGNVEHRENIINRWNTEFKHRLTPDYYQTFGLGFMEYFLTAEDIGAEPLPILNCGMACQFNTSELAPMNQLDPFVQDALDLIEFANGSTTTKWGKLRNDLGHPTPFNLKLIGIGNEQWGPQYIERWQVFEKAIKSKYPQMKLVSSAGPDPSDARFHYLDSTFRKNNADIIDEHYYRAPQWFLENATRYDNYPRNGPKIFAGEYAAQSVGIASAENRNNWQCAMSEAAFMTGLERNAGVVHMSSYAPLFGHVDAWQWTPDLIWFNNLTSYGTPNYYVQQLYSLNKGTHVVSLTSNGASVTGKSGVYASAVLDSVSKETIIKIVNTSSSPQASKLVLEGVGKSAWNGTLTVLSSQDLNAVNSIEKPTLVTPQTKPVTGKDNVIALQVAPQSFNIIRVKAVNK